MKMQIRKLTLFLLMATCAAPGPAQNAVSYRGLVRIPVDLQTLEGARLEKGQYEMDASPGEKRWTLTFRQSGVEKAVVSGKIREGDSISAAGSIPMAGTTYMRSSADPIAPAQERQFSKSGRAQYEEETREWNTAMRVYTTRDGDQVNFEFQQNRGNGKWQTVDFALKRSNGPSASVALK